MSLLKWMCESSRSAFREANDLTRPNPLALLASIFDRGRLGLHRRFWCDFGVGEFFSRNLFV